MRDSAHEARRWLRQAENDLEFARIAVREGFPAQACFVAQQTAEKAVKAIVYSLGERVVLGHSVAELLRRVAGRIEVPGGLDEDAGILDQYYVPTRYPNGLPGGVPFEAFSERQAREAVESADRFVVLARGALGEDG